MERYSVITEKNPREILLLRGLGCQWRRCTFCDYHLDFSGDETENYLVNREAIDRVTGVYQKLEVINSGSFVDLDDRTMQSIQNLCRSRGIREIHFECHWMHRNRVAELRRVFREMGVDVKVKIGVETFDAGFREHVLHKGIRESDPAVIAREFDEVCLLFGLTGQTQESMERDIETGLRYFERVCVNIMTENSTEVQPDQRVKGLFMEHIFPIYRDDPRVDILLNNTDFGVYIERKER